MKSSKSLANSLRLRTYQSLSPRQIVRPFHSTSPFKNQQQQSSDQQQQQQKKKEPEPDQDTTVAGRSPFQAFVDVLRDEVRKNREWQDSVKQLQGEASKVQDSEAMKRAREVYERARLTASIRENPRLQAAAEELRKAGHTVNDAVSHALKGMEENILFRGGRDALYKVGTAAYTASEPIRETEAYKAVAAEITEALDNAASNTQHGGYVEKEDRRRRRKARLEKAGKIEGMGVGSARKRTVKVEEDPDAGQAIQLHATANAPTKPSLFSTLAPQPLKDYLSNLSHAYQESDSAVISSLRVVTNGVGRFFDETETAKVVRLVKEMDPDFTQEGFVRELREYIVPELVEAYVTADGVTLKEWCSEGTYNVLMATLQPFISPSLISESRVLDIRNLDIMKVRILDDQDNLPVFVVAWRTQEVLAYRDLKTGEIAQGDEDRIEQVGYVAVFTRVEEQLGNETTGGWRVIDMARRAG
ncbi:Tim44-domain-containing protein [Meredithblackwellia eburnea MCA 4105]